MYKPRLIMALIRYLKPGGGEHIVNFGNMYIEIYRSSIKFTVEKVYGAFNNYVDQF